MKTPKSPKGIQTRERILRVAERLFAEHGYDGVSVRKIAAEAKVQLALVSYYFRSKLGLYRAVFQHRIEPISERRLDALNSILRRADPAPKIEEVLDALARPWVELRDQKGRQHYSRLVAREAGDPRESSRGIVKELLDPIALEFIAAMERALPGYRREEVHWAYYFFIGALLLAMANPERMRRLSGDVVAIDDSERLIKEIVGLFSDAFSARTRASALNPSVLNPKTLNPKAKSGEASHEARHLRVGERRTAQRRVDRQRPKGR